MNLKIGKYVEKTTIAHDQLTASIVADFEKLPKQLQKFARFALNHADVIALETVTTVASRAEVQPSSIVRFAKAFAFDGFTEMQQVFKTRLVENTSSYQERIRALGDDNREGGHSILDGFANSGIDSLERLKLEIPQEKLDQAIELITGARDVHLLAQKRAFGIAHYLHYALSQLNVRCFLADGAGGMLNHQISHVGPEDLVIAVSFAPYTPIVAELVDSLSNQGRKVISITDSAVSPLASRSTVSFEIHDGHDQAFRTLIAPICLAQSLVVGVGQALERKLHQKQETKNE